MTAIRKGLFTAGLVHGALLTLWLGYELTGKIYRQNLRLDFTLTNGGDSTGTVNAAAGKPEESGDEGDTDSAANAQTTSSAAKTAGASPGGGYANQNLSSISGLIHGKVYYPRIARQNNWQGRVLVHFVVTTAGKTEDVALRESSGHAALDSSALETIRELTGLPRPPVPVPLTVPVYFKLN